MIGIHVYQPLASDLGYRKPGGFRVEIAADGVRPVAQVLAACTDCAVDLSKLVGGDFAASCVVVVNRAVSRRGMETEVKDGDEVSLFRLVSGG
jgi:molybdopterin converting factor small subunit